MTERLSLLGALLLAGCLDIRTSGGQLSEQYEAAIPGLLRADAQVLFEVDDSFTVRPTLVAGVNSSGDPTTRVDGYPWDVDVEWTGLIGPHAVELSNAGSVVTAVEDTIHFEKVSSFTNGTYTSILYCDDALELWVHGLTPDGWRSATVVLGDPDDCSGTWVLGEGDSPDSLTLWSDHGAQRMRMTPPEGTGDITVEWTDLATPEGAPERVEWVAASASGGVRLVGRNTDGAWVYAASDQPPLTADDIHGGALGDVPVVISDGTALEVSTTAGQWAWDVDAGTAPSLIESYAPPDLDGDWVRGSWPGGALATERRLHPDSELIEVEVAVEALVRDDRGVRPLQVPLTPCVEDAPCQALGEWTVAGLYRGEDRWFVVYGYLSWWYGVSGGEVSRAYLAPLDE